MSLPARIFFVSGEIFQVRGTLYRWREYRQTGMGKSLFIAEKPSVAQEFAKALGESMTRHDGYQESENLLVTWCVGHLITMSYPDAYDERYKKWSLDTLPFLPDHFLYETIPSSRKQFGIVKHLLNRPDVETIYVCTDSGREGEYIYRLVRQEAGVKGKKEKRVWIDSQTEEEIRRGIREAKDLSAYDNLSAAAYLRAKEDYLMGINFSRALTLKYGSSMASFLGERYCVISVGRVMTCVLGMVVRREREIRDFKETPFYRVLARVSTGGIPFHAEWRSVEGSRYYQSPKLYKENGFRSREDAEQLIRTLTEKEPLQADLVSIEKKKEKKNPPLLYNLAELQNDCSRLFRISPDQTLNIVQDLYEKKLVTYPRTDARVLSSAIAKVIGQNLSGLKNFGPASAFAEEALQSGSWKTIAKTRYVDDKQITDHYALIPTGQGLGALKGLSSTAFGVYCTIVKRFLGIFYPPAVYRRISLVLNSSGEKFFASFRILEEEGYLSVMKESGKKKTEMDTRVSEMDAEYARMQEEIRLLRQDIESRDFSGQKAKLTAIIEEQQNKQNEYEENKRKISELSRQLDQVKKDVEAQVKEQQAVNQRISQENLQGAEKINELKKKMAGLELQKENCIREAEDYRSRVESLEAWFESLEAGQYVERAQILARRFKMLGELKEKIEADWNSIWRKNHLDDRQVSEDYGQVLRGGLDEIGKELLTYQKDLRMIIEALSSEDCRT